MEAGGLVSGVEGWREDVSELKVRERRKLMSMKGG